MASLEKRKPKLAKTPLPDLYENVDSFGTLYRTRWPSMYKYKNVYDTARARNSPDE